MADILIIEDDPVFGEILSMHLEDTGHCPRLADTLAKANEAIAEQIPDLVLLDQQLPDGHGLSLLEHLAAREPAPPP